MEDFIINELVCLRALEPIGSDRYEELSNAILWVQKQKLNEPKAQVPTAKKHNFAQTTIRYKDSGDEMEVIFKLSPYNEFADREIDPAIFFYCENEEDFESLREYDNGQDFEIVGCILFMETL